MTFEHFDQSPDVKAQAQFWVVELSDDELTELDLDKFRQWINASPVNERAYMESLEVWSDIGQMHQVALSHAALQPASNPAVNHADGAQDKPFSLGDFITSMIDRLLSRQGTLLWLPATATALLVLALFIPGIYDGGQTTTSYATHKSQIKDITLSDGSLVTLGAKSSLMVSFDDDRRQVTLKSGEAFFSVTKDSSRPFFVVVEGAAVRVVGTQFNVHRGSDQVRVSVKEGLVELIAFNKKEGAILNADQPPLARIGAKQLIIASHRGDILARNVVTGDIPGAWREGRLDYQGANLSEVVADANRYYDNDITIASADLLTQKVTASFRTDRIDQMIETLALALAIEIERTPYGSIILNKRKPAE
jgi:transmembrane sensor